MGLDMYVKEVVTPGFTNGVRDHNEDVTQEIAYWRKHPDLHGFIMSNYWNGPGDGNCQRIPLTVERVDAICDAIRAHTLPVTSGFFFGKSYFEDDGPDYRAEMDARDLAKWANVRAAILSGSEVYYVAWW